MPLEYEYTAYLDESGDDGLKNIRRVDGRGSSEWFVMSALLIKRQREPETDRWVSDLIRQLRKSGYQRPDLHFSNLSDSKKLTVTKTLAQLPVRCFAVMSNKKNMRRHNNKNAAKIPSQNWFYCWMTRLLLERVTAYTAERSLRDFQETKKLKIVFSERGGMSYSQFKAYLNWLRHQSSGGQLFLKQGDIVWDTIDTDLVVNIPHKESSGLQLSDTVASAFFKSVELDGKGKCNPQFAKILQPRMAMNPTGRRSGFSVKVMPNPRSLQIEPQQRDILKYYGMLW